MGLFTGVAWGALSVSRLMGIAGVSITCPLETEDDLAKDGVVDDGNNDDVVAAAAADGPDVFLFPTKVYSSGEMSKEVLESEWLLPTSLVSL